MSMQSSHRRIRLTKGNWVALFMIVGVAALMAYQNLPAFWPTHCGSHPKNACINNLRQIDGAKEQWALENHHYAGEVVNEDEVSAYIKGGRPVCPEGGKYLFGKLDEAPRCSIRGHVIQ